LSTRFVHMPASQPASQSFRQPVCEQAS
jgi:hypothetical protein